VLVGVALGGESVRALDILGMVIIITGVAAITLAKAKRWSLVAPWARHGSARRCAIPRNNWFP